MTPLVAAVVLFVGAVLLAVHHGWTHAHEDPATSAAQRESCLAACYLQPSDVCQFRSCNHETWIVVLLVLGAACLAWHVFAS